MSKMVGFNNSVKDSSGIFLLNELERLDRILHFPLTAVTWGRDIQLREDVTIADDFSSFTNSDFGAPGLNNKGKNFIASNSSEIAGISTSINKTMHPMHLWGTELGFTIIQLAQAMQVNRPLDDQLIRGLNLKYQMDIDEMVYIGDTDVKAKGLLTQSAVMTYSVSSNGAGKTLWVDKSADEILEDVNSFQSDVWANSALAFPPNKLILPPKTFASLISRKVSEANPMSIFNYIKENNIATAQSNTPLEIVPCKWNTTRGAGGLDRALFYTQDPMYVRYPLVPIQRTPLQFKGLSHLAYYYAKLGELEVPYVETVGYLDGM